MPLPIKKAIFPVGGLGTRFLPATKAIPKEMLPVLNKPLIQYAVEEALAAGIDELIFVTGKGKTAIEDHFDRDVELEMILRERPGHVSHLQALNDLLLPPGKVVYIRQQEPLGLGHAIWCARHLVEDGPFAVLLADDFICAPTPCLLQLIQNYQGRGGSWAAVMEVPQEQTSRYGILDIASRNGPLVQAKGLVEKPPPMQAPSCTAIVGRYLLSPAVMPVLDKLVHGADQQAGAEIQLTDALALLLKAEPFWGLHFEGQRFDCGSLSGMFEATVALARTHPALQESVQKLWENERREGACRT
jgi:UTP--glucose-1-phosphate uridylyltransferase